MDEHDRLEEVYTALLASYDNGDWNEVRAEWEVFDRALREHMQTEEERLLHAFRTIDPDEAAAIVGEHDDLRLQLDAFGVLVDLHAFTRSEADELLRRLRAHAGREERLFYPWAVRVVSAAR